MNRKEKKTAARAAYREALADLKRIQQSYGAGSEPVLFAEVAVRRAKKELTVT